jgi:hypothetical protein
MTHHHHHPLQDHLYLSPEDLNEKTMIECIQQASKQVQLSQDLGCHAYCWDANNHLVNSNEKMCTVCSGGASP